VDDDNEYKYKRRITFREQVPIIEHILKLEELLKEPKTKRKL